METLKTNVVSLLGAERMLYARWCRVRKQVSLVGRMGTWRDREHTHICLASREGNSGRNHVKNPCSS